MKRNIKIETRINNTDKNPIEKLKVSTTSNKTRNSIKR
jgi:hypothetical protein